jgi:hypothetical protein
VEFELDSRRRLGGPGHRGGGSVEVIREQQGYRVQGSGARRAGLRLPRPTAWKPCRVIPRRRRDRIRTPGRSISRYYRVTFDRQTGAIASIFDKDLGRELAEAARPHTLNQLLYVSGGDTVTADVRPRCI